MKLPIASRCNWDLTPKGATAISSGQETIDQPLPLSHLLLSHLKDSIMNRRIKWLQSKGAQFWNLLSFVDLWSFLKQIRLCSGLRESKMNRRACVAVTAATLFAVLVPAAAKASTLTYNLSLNPIIGTEAGTGSLTIVAPPVGSSGILTQGSGLTALDFKIDGLDFTLNNTSEVAYFYQGTNLVLASIGYSGQIGTDKLFTISLGNLGGYAFNDSGILSVGSISAVSATPIPQSLPLLATGLGALALLGLWRKRKVGAAIATA